MMAQVQKCLSYRDFRESGPWSENGCGIWPIFGLEGQDFENQAEQPHQKFPGVPPIPTLTRCRIHLPSEMG